MPLLTSFLEPFSCSDFSCRCWSLLTSIQPRSMSETVWWSRKNEDRTLSFCTDQENKTFVCVCLQCRWERNHTLSCEQRRSENNYKGRTANCTSFQRNRLYFPLLDLCCITTQHLQILIKLAASKMLNSAVYSSRSKRYLKEVQNSMRGEVQRSWNQCHIMEGP